MGTPPAMPLGSRDPRRGEGREPKNAAGLLVVKGRKGKAAQGETAEGLDELSVSLTLLLVRVTKYSTCVTYIFLATLQDKYSLSIIITLALCMNLGLREGKELAQHHTVCK